MSMEQIKKEIVDTIRQVNATSAAARDAVTGIGAGHAIAIAGIADLLIAKGLVTRDEVQAWLLIGLEALTDQQEKEPARKAVAHVLALLERGYPRPH